MNIRTLLALILVVGASACSSQKVVSSTTDQSAVGSNTPAATSTQSATSTNATSTTQEDKRMREVDAVAIPNPLRSK
ncbi:hypothetical protein [Polluticoccus soli]|uniref:hypothetical protein n=1 Tax=Polluticoccus soli TaxID=3034150 RepID=UPI0023E21626|nr:hypothetical protein [Flavipsychrobacter sp. JY13-12]